MPYKTKGKCIYKKDTGKKVGCTTGSVEKYMSALHANIKESFDDAILHYLSEMDNTQGTLGASTTTTASQDGKIQSVNHNSVTQRDPNDPAYQKETCVGKDHNNVRHVEEVKQKLKKTEQEAIDLIKQYRQPTPTPNTQPLNKPVYTKLQPAVASAAPSTTYSSQPAI